ncbi:MAG: hypothetical protein OXQ94_15735 [Gemmatimonadota bacterium]|nr:hypothetical protein [Gemmatimonadota bacterium]MDE2873129.1 hypothetical protein [Gemmatimonadota bacterium]
MFRPSRERRGEDRFLAWKVRIFVAGAALALAGIGMSLSWLVWVGIGVLVVGLLLRFLPDGG